MALELAGAASAAEVTPPRLTLCRLSDASLAVYTGRDNLSTVNSVATMSLTGKTAPTSFSFSCLSSHLWLLTACPPPHLLAYTEKMRELPLMSLFCSCILRAPRDSTSHEKEGEQENKSFDHRTPMAAWPDLQLKTWGLHMLIFLLLLQRA